MAQQQAAGDDGRRHHRGSRLHSEAREHQPGALALGLERADRDALEAPCVLLAVLRAEDALILRRLRSSRPGQRETSLGGEEETTGRL